MIKPLVSIVTPCYNSEKYIEETIQSVINQTYTNWEMIICDDCSSDNTTDIIKSYINIDGRIKLIRTTRPSGAPAIPRNLCIDTAQGEYIAFLDSDDIWMPNKLHEQIMFMQNSNLDFVYSNCIKISSSGNYNGKIVVRSKVNYAEILKSCEITSPTVVLSRKIIGNTRFINTHNEDYIFWIEILKKGITAYNTGSFLAKYRIVKNSRSSNKLRMAKYHWDIIHHREKIPRLKALTYMVFYAIKGLRKR